MLNIYLQLGFSILYIQLSVLFLFKRGSNGRDKLTNSKAHQDLS